MIADKEASTENSIQKCFMQYLLTVSQQAATHKDLSEMRHELDNKFNRLDAKIAQAAARLNVKIDTLAQKIDSKIDAVTWGIMVSIAIIITATMGVLYFLTRAIS